MDWYVWALLGGAAGAAAASLVAWLLRRAAAKDQRRGSLVRPLLESHFAPAPLAELTIAERSFPFRVRADLHRALDRIFGAARVLHFTGVRREHSYEAVAFAGLLIDGHNPTFSVPPEHEDLDIGEEQPVRCLKNGLWLLEQDGQRFAVLLAPVSRHFGGESTGVQFQIAVLNNPQGTQITQLFFKSLEEAVLQAESYRGKVLSLEQAEHGYSGATSGITVHRLRAVGRDDVILPGRTLELLDRNVVQFVKQRKRLAALGLGTKKGLLFYGPPGTGKTLTIHYLAGALAGHTTLLISAEQVGLLAEYMTLARLLQPSVVVMEDVDLIARERTQMNSPCEEVLLNKLLNEMDGLKEEADVLFILTTNRPEALEAALASRPGRVDQAIEFPLPDPAGREKLVRLYARGVALEEGLVGEVVGRTDRVSAAFIKELMRRAVQFQLERDGDGPLTRPDVERAMEEMVFSGGALNLKLLGAAEARA